MTAAPIRWGILGTGWIADQMVTDLIGSGLTVQAVGSRSQEAADAFADKYGIEHRYSSYEALVNADDIDIVYVGTPHPLHFENASMALRAGKHVLCEKPITLNARDTKALADLAAEQGVLLLEAMWTRFLPGHVRIREIIEAGTIGEVRELIADHNQNLPRDPKHRINNPELGGGALLDLGIYPISFAYQLFGSPSTVLSHAAFTSTGVDRQTSIILGYEDGRQAVLTTALDLNGPVEAVIVGTAGRIELEPWWYAPGNFTVYNNDNEVIERYEANERLRGMQYQAFEAEALIRAGKTASDILSPSDSVAIMQILDTVRSQIGLVYPGE